MAFQLALGCRSVGYGSEHRECNCKACKPLSCFQGCSAPLSIMIDIGGGGDCCPDRIVLSDTDYVSTIPTASGNLCDVLFQFNSCTGSVYKRFVIRQTLGYSSGINVISHTLELQEQWVETIPGLGDVGVAVKTTTYTISQNRTTGGCFRGFIVVPQTGSTTYENETYGDWCDHPTEILTEFCNNNCILPSCLCWQPSDGAYRILPKTAYLDVCNGTVLPPGPTYTGCSNGAYFLACGTGAGPCWSLAANCGSNYGASFGCNVAGIVSAGGYILTLSYSASQVFYRLISYTNVSPGGSNLQLACEITGAASAAGAVPTGCPSLVAPTCGFSELSRTVNYFTFPAGNINSRTVIDYTTFLALAVDAFAPLCDYTGATVELDFA